MACSMSSMNLLFLSGLFAAAETAHPELLDRGVVFVFTIFVSIILLFSAMWRMDAICSFKVHPYLIEAHCKYSKENAVLI